MEWTLSDTLALAHPKCKHCQGMGLRERKNGTSVPCHCVFRAIFRACFSRFRECVEKANAISRVTLDATPAGGRRITWGRKDEEFVADFLLVTKRSLSPLDYRIFSYHFLLGAEWRLCCRKLDIERGDFFHQVYRIQERLGRVYRELQPYSLFPLDEYFNGRTTNVWPDDSVFRGKPDSFWASWIAAKPRPKRIPVRPPALGKPLMVPVLSKAPLPRAA